MQIGKILISFFLLLTYSLGFAHEIIPHCHIESEIAFGNDNGEDSHHHHEHHSHETDDHLDHEHINHQDHLDDGFYDFVVCLLSESEHSQSSTHHHYVPSNPNSISFKGLDKIKNAVTLLAVVTSIKCDIQLTEFGKENEDFYLPPPILYAPHRGPPSLFLPLV